jgi:hypothetical protein
MPVIEECEGTATASRELGCQGSATPFYLTSVRDVISDVVKKTYRFHS